MDKLLTVKDIQVIFDMGKNQAYDLMNSAGFPSLKINNRIFVSETKLDEWVSAYTGRDFKTRIKV